MTLYDHPAEGGNMMRTANQTGALLAVLSACGGGGSTSISLSTTDVTFIADVGGPEPASQTIHVTFQGDGVLVGYPSEVAPPTWLTATELGHTATTADISLTVLDTATVGTRTTTLRFVTGKVDGSQVQFADLHVTFTVATPFGANAPTMTFTAIGPQPPQPTGGYAIAIQGGRARWRASASVPWLSMSPTSGSGVGSVSVIADGTTLAAGTAQGNIVITDDASGRQVTLPVTLTKQVPLLTATASQFDVELSSSPSALTQQIVVSDEIGGTAPSWGANWSLQSVSVDWLQWSPSTGKSSPPSIATLTIDGTKIASLDNGNQAATVVLSYITADGTTRTLSIPISLFICLPHADRVGPYIATANQGGHIYIRGSGYTCRDGLPVVRLGTTQLATGFDSDTQMQADYPALSPGRYPVLFDNHLGVALGSPELVVLGPPGFAYQAIAAAGSRERLVYDAERETLYAVNRTAQSIERYARSGGTWSALPPIVVPDVRDVDLSPDGRLLLVASVGSIGDIDLSVSTALVVERAMNPDPFCGGHFAHLAVSNSNKVFVVFNLANCSGFTQPYLYDLRSHALTQMQTILFDAIAAASADGSRIYAGSRGVSPAQSVFIFDGLDDSFGEGPVAYSLFAASVSGNASRVLLQGTDVLSRSLSLTGRVPAGGGAAASRDSSRAFVYRDDSPGPRVEVYDLNGALVIGGLYPLAKTITLADSPNLAAGSSVQIIPSADDSAVFVSGNAGLLVVPVN